MVETDEGYTVPAAELPDDDLPDGPRRGRPTYRVLNEWRAWMDRYESAHIEFDSPEGETVRRRLENSYQQEYADRYYARTKDFERGVNRRWNGVTPVMLTLTASTENANGNPRCPADHMREIAAGWDTARKQLDQALSGLKWEYVRIWEPHESGYGHLHVGIFVEGGGDLEAERFRPVMRSYVKNVKAAGSEAHSPSNAVSVNGDVENLGSYLTEYLGQYGEPLQERPLSEQVFYATTWATNTRRLDFSNGAQEIIAGEEFRRETGLRPEDRGGGTGCASSSGETDGSAVQSDGSDEGDGWGVNSLCYVPSRAPSYTDPVAGGVATVEIEGRPGLDPPAQRK